MEAQERVRDRDRDNPWVRVTARKSPPSKSFFSVFAANLTFDTTEEDLLRIFGRFGKIQDVFIPWDRQLHRSRGFAFIRFLYEQDAFNAIQCLHDRRIDGRVAHVDWAKGHSRRPRVQPPTPPHPESLQTPPGMARQYVEVLVTDKPGERVRMEGSSGITTIADPGAVENRLRGLKMALVGTAEDRSVRIDRITGPLKNPHLKLSVVEVARINVSKFLLMFRSEADMAAVRENVPLQKEMGLESVELWSPEEVIGADGVWIRVFGIPAHAWIETVILDLASYFGKITQLDSNSRFGHFQAFARIKVILRPGVNFSTVLRLNVLGKEYPIIAEMEPLFHLGPPSSIKQVPYKSTKEWVVRRFHQGAERPSDVCGNAEVREVEIGTGKPGCNSAVCTTGDLRDDTLLNQAADRTTGDLRDDTLLNQAADCTVYTAKCSSVSPVVAANGSLHMADNVTIGEFPPGFRQNTKNRGTHEKSDRQRVLSTAEGTPLQTSAEGPQQGVECQQDQPQQLLQHTENLPTSQGEYDMVSGLEPYVQPAGSAPTTSATVECQQDQPQHLLQHTENLPTSQGEYDMVSGLEPYVQPSHNMAVSFSHWDLIHIDDSRVRNVETVPKAPDPRLQLDGPLITNLQSDQIECCTTQFISLHQPLQYHQTTQVVSDSHQPTLVDAETESRELNSLYQPVDPPNRSSSPSHFTCPNPYILPDWEDCLTGVKDMFNDNMAAAPDKQRNTGATEGQIMTNQRDGAQNTRQPIRLWVDLQCEDPDPDIIASDSSISSKEDESSRNKRKKQRKTVQKRILSDRTNRRLKSMQGKAGHKEWVSDD